VLTNARFACKACEVITVQLEKFSRKSLSLHVLRRDDFSREEGENLEDEAFHRQSFVRGCFACSILDRNSIWRHSMSSFFESGSGFEPSRHKAISPFAFDSVNSIQFAEHARVFGGEWKPGNFS
jgi:hypothetical protein